MRSIPQTDHERFLVAVEQLTKDLGIHGPDPKHSHILKAPVTHLTPDQLLSIQVMMGNPKRLTTLFTLGADPQSAYEKALAFENEFLVQLLEEHGAVKNKKKSRSKKSANKS